MASLPRPCPGGALLLAGGTCPHRERGSHPVRVSSYNRLALLTTPALIGEFQGSKLAIERLTRNDRWDPQEDEVGNKVFKPLTAEEASVLRAQDPAVSPWRVLAVMLAVGVVSALLAGVLTQRQEMAWSVLYGAAAVVVPGALMARGMTSKLSSMSPGSSAVSFMLWEMVKIAVSVVMLALAPKLVPNLSFPAMLVGVVLCMKVYWVALLWRGKAAVPAAATPAAKVSRR